VAQLAPLRLTVPPLQTLQLHTVYGDELDTLPDLHTMLKRSGLEKAFFSLPYVQHICVNWTASHIAAPLHSRNDAGDNKMY